MITYYVHPPKDGQQIVSRKRNWKGDEQKPYLSIAALIDLPDYWWEEEWNLHYDGCDYPFSSVLECLQRIREYDAYDKNNERDECMFVFTYEKFVQADHSCPHKTYTNFDW